MLLETCDKIQCDRRQARDFAKKKDLKWFSN